MYVRHRACLDQVQYVYRPPTRRPRLLPAPHIRGRYRASASVAIAAAARASARRRPAGRLGRLGRPAGFAVYARQPSTPPMDYAKEQRRLSAERS
jgi:hypothetical protein